MHRDHGGRDDRQKARLMWLVEEWGVDKFREEVGKRMGQTLREEVHVEYPGGFGWGSAPGRDELCAHCPGAGSGTAHQHQGCRNQSM